MDFKKITHHKDFKLYVLLFLIISLGIFLRFYNAPNLYYLDGDAVRDAIIAHEGAKKFYLPLSGPFSSTGPFTFGPWYFYSLIATAFIFPYAYAPWILMGIVSVISIFLMYKIGVLVGSKKFGLLLATITAIAPTQISAGTGLSNINPVPFFTILSVFLLLKILIKKHTTVLLILFGASLGLGINAHFQAIGLLILPVLLWLYKDWKNISIPFFIALGLIITFIPMLLFNIQSDWHTLRGIEQAYIAKDQIYVANSWKIYLFEYWPSFLAYITNLPLLIIMPIIVALVGVFFLNLLKKKIPLGINLLIVFFSISFIYLRYYWGERNFVYLYYLEPIVLIFIAYGLFQIIKLRYGKFFFTFIMILLAGGMLSKDYQRLQAQPQTQIQRENYVLSQKYPDARKIIYSCSMVNDNNAQALAYLLSFEKNNYKNSEKIGVISNEKCDYPKTSSFNFTEATISAKLAPHYYPRLAKTSTLVKFSVASESAIKQASWSAVSTNEIFESSVKWWQKK